MNLSLSELVGRLEGALRGPLPGREAHALMLPQPPVTGLPPRAERSAAALALLYPRDGAPHLLLTVRHRSLPDHPGQVSLPGGMVDEGEDLETAARREAHEETGVSPETVRVLGPLSPLSIPVSGFLLHTFVGTTEIRPRFRPHPPEVERILEVPFSRLADASAVATERRFLRGREREVPGFLVEDVFVWGATAMILAEILWLAGIRVRT